MEDYAITQGQRMLVFLFAFLLTAVSSYPWTSWMIWTQRINGSEPKPIATVFTRLGRIRAFVKCNFPRSLFQRRWETPKSSLGEWLAPVIAWLAVMLVSVAVVGLLLGEE
jgi:hypothetical protein